MYDPLVGSSHLYFGLLSNYLLFIKSVPINVVYERSHLELCSFMYRPCNYKCVSVDIINLCRLPDTNAYTSQHAYNPLF